MQRTLTGTVVAIVVMFVGTSPAATPPQGPKYELTATLLPRDVVGYTPHAPTHARGAFFAKVNVFWRDGSTLAPRLRLTGASRASQTRRTAEITARLTPVELTRPPTGIHATARGSFRATFWPFGDGWEQAHFWLSTRRLTGTALSAHIHTGAPGRNGPVLLTLCEAGRCNLSGTTFHAYPVGFVKTMRILGAYVDVHTAKNPRGELRGQIHIHD